jgi:hypothetical protein
MLLFILLLSGCVLTTPSSSSANSNQSSSTSQISSSESESIVSSESSLLSSSSESESTSESSSPSSSESSSEVSYVYDGYYASLQGKTDAQIFPEKDSLNVIYRKYQAYKLWPEVFYINKDGLRVKIKKMSKDKIERIVVEGKNESDFPGF